MITQPVKVPYEGPVVEVIHFQTTGSILTGLVCTSYFTYL